MRGWVWLGIMIAGCSSDPFEDIDLDSCSASKTVIETLALDQALATVDYTGLTVDAAGCPLSGHLEARMHWEAVTSGGPLGQEGQLDIWPRCAP